MAEGHPNIALLQRLDLHDLGSAAELFADDFVWHFFNPRLPDMQGDYVGLAGLRSFFEKIMSLTGGSFKVHPVSLTAVGDELVVAQTRNTMTLQGQQVATDVVVVWRIVDNRIKEVWDIPSVYTRPSTP